jgi:hypothetical protein
MKAILQSENEFTKIFKIEEEIDLFITKAYDEELDHHFIVASIPKIADLKIEHIQFPIKFEDNEKERDRFFKDFNNAYAEMFIKNLIDEIIRQKNTPEVDTTGENP